ncbi:MAG TPA: GNAT family N-acetyltransferase [Gaiellaceae bacterium]|nr:GNAT family N-acetyltransferase [Gaiellaceae bacterium]
MSSTIVEPSTEQVLEFCARDPVERVFLEDVARRDLGRFSALERADGTLGALCHVGANIVPSGEGCGAFAPVASRGRLRMIIGEAGAVSDLWREARGSLPAPREDRPGQPVYVIDEPPPAGGTGLRAATPGDLDRLVPACAAAHALELGVDPLERDPEGFRWRTLAQIDEGRSWLWLEGGVVRFKAEASAWTPEAVQVQQVWVDPEARRRGYAARALRDLCRLLLETTPRVTLFVRRDNLPAIRLYESIGMRRALEYRSVLF